MAFSLFGILAVILETIRPFLPVIGLVIVVEIIFIALVLRRPQRSWRRGLPLALIGGIVVGLLILALGPWLTSATHADLAGLLDWLALFGAALAGTALVALLLWPPAALMLSRKE